MKRYNNNNNNNKKSFCCYLNRFYYVNMFVVSGVMENHNVICLNWIISRYVSFSISIYINTDAHVFVMFLLSQCQMWSMLYSGKFNAFAFQIVKSTQFTYIAEVWH